MANSQRHRLFFWRAARLRARVRLPTAPPSPPLRPPMYAPQTLATGLRSSRSRRTTASAARSVATVELASAARTGRRGARSAKSVGTSRARAALRRARVRTAPPPRHRVAHHDLLPAAMTVSQRACLTTARMCARARVCVRSRPAPGVARHLRLDRLADVFLLSRSRFTVLGLYTGCALRGMGRGEHAYLNKGERR